MYLLAADDRAMLTERAQLFARYMEPVLGRLETHYHADKVAADFTEIPQYLQVCRWPFRQLEYSFALDVLLRHLQPGDAVLDAGSGVTPFAHVLAGQQMRAFACDSDARLIAKLRALEPDSVYGTPVEYATQDLTALSYPDETFDAITCISVLEHIPAPLDQAAIRELFRALKPGGVLVMTVDFTPTANGQPTADVRHRLLRTARLALRGQFGEVGRAAARKITARRAVQAGEAHFPRSANQCFHAGHLEQDILPAMAGEEWTSSLGYSPDICSSTDAQARQFWDLEAGLYNNQGRRAVLPVGIIVQKETCDVRATG